jgi:uncharacterized membrane-anchored protein YitT (DUF2179 family)
MKRDIYSYRSEIGDVLFILMGSILLALSLVFFLIPNKIVTGGIAGLAIVLHYMIELPTGLIMLILNLALLLVGLKYLGKKFLYRTLITIVLTSFFTDFFSINLKLGALTRNFMLATLYGGLLIGLGLGLIFKGDSSAGGGTIIARVISDRSRFRTGQVLLAIDVIVVTSAAVTFRNIELALWGFITIFISSQIIDLILTGKPFAKVVHIVTQDIEGIRSHIIQDLGKGITILPIQGLISDKKRNLMMVIIDSNQIYRLRDIVRYHDSEAFVIVMDATEILGHHL